MNSCKTATSFMEIFIEKELEFNSFYDYEKLEKTMLVRCYDILKLHYDSCKYCSELYEIMFALYDEANTLHQIGPN